MNYDTCDCCGDSIIEPYIVGEFAFCCEECAECYFEDLYFTIGDRL